MKTLFNSKKAIGLFITLTSFVVISIAFSNCGDVQFGTTQGKPQVDTLVVDPGNNGQSVPPGGNGDGGGTPPGGGNPPPGGGKDCDKHHGRDHKEHKDCDRDDDHNDEKDCDKHHDRDHKEHKDCDKDDEHHDHDKDRDHDCKHHGKCSNSNEDDDTKHKRYCHSRCGNNGIKDIIVNIEKIEIRGTKGEVLEISGDLGETSIISGKLPLLIEDDIEVVSIRLILAETGNVLIDNDNKSFALKVPSGSQSGLKIPVRGVMSVAKGAYEVSFGLDLKTFMKHSRGKCMLKPVLRFISLLPI